MYLKKLLKIACAFVFIFNPLSTVAENDVKMPLIIESYADVVEPLIPAVVNISVVNYPRKKNKDSGEKSSIPDSQLEFFNDFFEKFGIPNQGFEEFLNEKKVEGSGSGFIIDSTGYIVTNYHVIKDADEISVKLFDNTEINAKLIGSDPRTDLALLKIEFIKPLPFVKFGSSESARVGDRVLAIGSPFKFGNTVTEGIISFKSRDIDLSVNGIVDEYIQVDAAINRGNSGGPLFNLRGEVIGVNTAIYSPSGTNIGIGFAIPSSIVENVIDKLKKFGKVSRGRLNIHIDDVNEEIAESLNMKALRGVIVIGIERGGAGEKAGLKVGDVIVEYNGGEVKTKKKLSRLVAETVINSKVTLKVLRDGNFITLSTILPEVDSDKVVKGDIQSKKDIASENNGPTLKLRGVTLGDSTPQIRNEYGLKGTTQGVIVLGSEANSPWSKKGLLKGDVITSINQHPVSSVKAFEQIYNKAVKDKKKNILVLIKRHNSVGFLTLPIE